MSRDLARYSAVRLRPITQSVPHAGGESRLRFTRNEKASVRREETGDSSHAYEIVTRFGLRMRTKADVDRSLAGMKARYNC